MKIIPQLILSLFERCSDRLHRLEFIISVGQRNRRILALLDLLLGAVNPVLQFLVQSVMLLVLLLVFKYW
jgi:hypothetical protein